MSFSRLKIRILTFVQLQVESGFYEVWPGF